MTVGQKLEALRNAVNTAWDDAYDDWEWYEDEKNPKKFVLGEKLDKNCIACCLAGREDIYGGWVWIEYEPEKDMVGVYIKDRPIQAKFKEDLKNLFEKYSPFDMKVSFERNAAPVIFRKEKIETKDLLEFFGEFKKAYDEYYPLFYMFSVSSKEQYDGFLITHNWL